MGQVGPNTGLYEFIIFYSFIYYVQLIIHSSIRNLSISLLSIRFIYFLYHFFYVADVINRRRTMRGSEGSNSIGNATA